MSDAELRELEREAVTGNAHAMIRLSLVSCRHGNHEWSAWKLDDREWGDLVQKFERAVGGSPDASVSSRQCFWCGTSERKVDWCEGTLFSDGRVEKKERRRGEFAPGDLVEAPSGELARVTAVESASAVMPHVNMPIGTGGNAIRRFLIPARRTLHVLTHPTGDRDFLVERVEVHAGPGGLLLLQMTVTDTDRGEMIDETVAGRGRFCPADLRIRPGSAAMISLQNLLADEVGVDLEVHGRFCG